MQAGFGILEKVTNIAGCPAVSLQQAILRICGKEIARI